MSDEHDMREAIKSLRAAGNIDAAQNLQDRLDSGSGPESEPGPGGPGQDTGRCAQLAAAGAHVDAIECLDRLIRAGGDDPTPYELMAVSQEAVGNLKKAATHLDRALELAGGKDGARYRILVGLAALWIRHGRPGKAVTIIEKRGSGVPRPDSRLSELHGRALLMQDKHAKAIAVFEAAAAGTGKEDGGGEEKGRNPDASLLAGLCKALYETGRHADAAQRGTEAGAGSAEANLYAALALERAGRPDGAAAHYGMAASAGVSDAHTEDDSWYRAAALYRTGRPKEAARSLGLAVDDGAAPSPAAAGASPAHTPAAPGPAFCCLAGRILEGMGRPAEAQHMYRRAFRTGGKNGCSGSLYHAALACRLLAEPTGDGSWNNKARDLARRALSCNGLHPDARDLSEEVAELLRPKKGPQTPPRPGGRRDGRSQRDVPPARRRPDTAKHVTVPRPDPGGASRGKVTKHPVRQYTEAAAGAFAEAADLIGDGRYSEALDCLEKNRGVFMGGARDHPARIKEQYFRGIIHCGQGRYGEAAACLGEAADLAKEPPHKPPNLDCFGYTLSESPRRADACLLAGLAHYRMGLRGQFEDFTNNRIDVYPEAHRMLEMAGRLDPGLKGVKTLLGMTRMQMARFRMFDTAEEEAITTLCGAIREDPEDAAALYHLAQILEQREGSTGDAGAGMPTPGDLYGRACESPASTLEDTYARGYALDLSHRHAEAVECYRRAIRMDPEYDEDFCDMVDDAHLTHLAPAPSTPKSRPESETRVIDANIGIPCTVMLVLGLRAVWRGLGVIDKIDALTIPDSWEQNGCLLDGFEECVSAGRYVIPETARWEIRKNVEGVVSRGLGTGQELTREIADMATQHLRDMCPSADTQVTPEFGYGDIMRVKRMYWLAWIRMTPGEKEEYMGKKRFGQLRGGPPLGSADVKILATAARMAAEGGTRVVLLTDDHDFLAFRDEIAGLFVDVQEVGEGEVGE